MSIVSHIRLRAENESEERRKETSFYFERRDHAVLRRLGSKSVWEEDYETLERTTQLCLQFFEELKRDDVTMADIRSLFTMNSESRIKK